LVANVLKLINLTECQALILNITSKLSRWKLLYT